MSDDQTTETVEQAKAVVQAAATGLAQSFLTPDSHPQHVAEERFSHALLNLIAAVRLEGEQKTDQSRSDQSGNLASLPNAATTEANRGCNQCGYGLDDFIGETCSYCGHEGTRVGPDMAGTEPLLSVGEAREHLNTQLRCMADEIRAWGTVVDAQVDDAIDNLIVASALTERHRLRSETR